MSFQPLGCLVGWLRRRKCRGRAWRGGLHTRGSARGGNRWRISFTCSVRGGDGYTGTVARGRLCLPHLRGDVIHARATHPFKTDSSAARSAFTELCIHHRDRSRMSSLLPKSPAPFHACPCPVQPPVASASGDVHDVRLPTGGGPGDRLLRPTRVSEVRPHNARRCAVPRPSRDGGLSGGSGRL